MLPDAHCSLSYVSPTPVSPWGTLTRPERTLIVDVPIGLDDGVLQARAERGLYP